MKHFAKQAFQMVNKIFNTVPQVAEDLTIALAQKIKAAGITAMNGIFEKLPEQQRVPVCVKADPARHMKL